MRRAMGARGRPPTRVQAPDDESSGATAQQILEGFIPLVIKAAADSATGLTMAAAAMSALQAELQELKSENQGLRVEVRELKTELGKLKSSGRSSEKNSRAWLQFLKSVFTPAVVVQILVILSAALGLYTQLPEENDRGEQRDRGPGEEEPSGGGELGL